MVHNKDTKDEFDMIPDEENIIDNNDFDIENDDESSKDKIRLLKEKLKASEEEKRTYLDDLQRTRADFLNSKRRLEEQLARDKE